MRCLKHVQAMGLAVVNMPRSLARGRSCCRAGVDDASQRLRHVEWSCHVLEALSQGWWRLARQDQQVWTRTTCPGSRGLWWRCTVSDVC